MLLGSLSICPAIPVNTISQERLDGPMDKLISVAPCGILSTTVHCLYCKQLINEDIYVTNGTFF